jgi:hypothetical protein
MDHVDGRDCSSAPTLIGMAQSSRGMAVVVVVGAAVVAMVAYVYVSAYGTGDPRSERAAALKAARYEQAKVHAPVLVSTYQPNAGAHQESNTGHACFGRTVLVRLMYPENVGLASGNTAGDPPGHQAVLATADATSGTVCFVSVAVGSSAANPQPDEVYLFGPSKALLHRSQ